MTISCSGYKIIHTEVTQGFRKEPTNDFHRTLDDENKKTIAVIW
jgi:hypothetical protein